jgi:cobalt-zinc-cadmium efflux system protein
MCAEFFGGLYANSLSLIADAGHMLTDVAAMALTLGAIWFTTRPANERKTFGYYRAEILAALANGIALCLICFWVCIEAVERWRSPETVKGVELIFIAAGGLIVNLISASLLHHHGHHDLNMRGAWLHVIGDALGSVTAIGAGVLIYLFNFHWADPLGSILISIIILYGAYRLIRESVDILLEGAPPHIDLAEVEKQILETSGVSAVHDLHVWTISSGLEALSAHVRMTEDTVPNELLKRLRRSLNEKFGIDHLTIQMETGDFEDEDIHFCHGPRCFDSSTAGRTERITLN